MFGPDMAFLMLENNVIVACYLVMYWNRQRIGSPKAVNKYKHWKLVFLALWSLPYKRNRVFVWGWIIIIEQTTNYLYKQPAINGVIYNFNVKNSLNVDLKLLPFHFIFFQCFSILLREIKYQEYKYFVRFFPAKIFLKFLYRNYQGQCEKLIRPGFFI